MVGEGRLGHSIARPETLFVGTGADNRAILEDRSSGKGIAPEERTALGGLVVLSERHREETHREETHRQSEVDYRHR